MTLIMTQIRLGIDDWLWFDGQAGVYYEDEAPQGYGLEIPLSRLEMLMTGCGFGKQVSIIPRKWCLGARLWLTRTSHGFASLVGWMSGYVG